MHYLIALMLAFLSLLAVSYPLLKAREREDQSKALSNAKERLGRKVEDAFDDIDRLQMEFELGVIERQEYQQQMDDLRRVAAVSLHAYEEEAQGGIDGAPTLKDRDDLLEERIRIRRLAQRSQDSESL